MSIKDLKHIIVNNSSSNVCPVRLRYQFHLIISYKSIDAILFCVGNLWFKVDFNMYRHYLYFATRTHTATWSDQTQANIWSLLERVRFSLTSTLYTQSHHPSCLKYEICSCTEVFWILISRHCISNSRTTT